MHDVGCRFAFDLLQPSVLAIQVAPAMSTGTIETERFEFGGDEHRRPPSVTSVEVDTAIDTLVVGAGVCRDGAHLTIALCRALGIPARLAAAYAPGPSSMDVHAVAEVLTPDGWVVLDATRLAPRPTRLRIATGRDAADTAFATTLRGDAELLDAQIHASTAAALPVDDHVAVVRLA